MGSKFRLKSFLAREQLAFLRRPRKHWATHLRLAREFFGEALKNSDPAHPVLILGAGWGLEVPWRFAPTNTFGWDADPLSRFGTFIRHRRWAPWIFDDITGAFAELGRVSRRVQFLEGRWVPRPALAAAKRLAGLLPSVAHFPKALEMWVKEYRPGTIICANMMGQIKPIAYRIVELAFKPRVPWINDQDLNDPLHAALDTWTAGAIKSILDVFRQSGSSLYLLHDKGVIHQETDLALGEWADSWLEQIKTTENCLEASDPLSGVDILNELKSLTCLSKARWIWPIGSKQIHVIEALAFRP